MSAVGFGRRGSTPLSTPPLFGRQTEQRIADAAAVEGVDGGTRLIAHIPFLTAGLIVLLCCVFAIERRFALDIGKKSAIDLDSLIAFGGISFDLVVKQHQWWRIFLAPLLHGSIDHLIGNCIALAIIGYSLEARIGRGWYAATFLIGALAGVAGSILGNPPDATSVGASGAITGLIAALFAMSFHPNCDAIERASLRRVSLRFGIPAIAPLFLGATSHVDYFAHLGGAIGGGLIGWGLAIFWTDGGFRPAFGAWAGGVALLGFLASGGSSFFAASQWSAMASIPGHYIPAKAMPADLDAGASVSADLVTRYPNDARSHLFRAHWFARSNNRLGAEQELRTAVFLANAPRDRAAHDLAQAYLAIVLLSEGKRREAGDLAREACRSQIPHSIKTNLVKARLCD